MAPSVREDENASENQQRKREAEDADEVEVAPRVITPSLSRLRAALIGPTARTPHMASAAPIENPCV